MAVKWLEEIIRRGGAAVLECTAQLVQVPPYAIARTSQRVWTEGDRGAAGDSREKDTAKGERGCC
eukprot:3783052-Rhodomonas_salina.1